MSKIVMVYVSFPTEEKAQEIARSLLDKNLIACAMMVPGKSIYRWNGAIECDAEIMTIFKTMESCFDDFKKELESLHPYQIPCILKIESVVANDAYKTWMIDSLKCL
jgi:periplasmic divalent cation tolerance protein